MILLWLAACGTWLSGAEVGDWLEGTTCDGGAVNADADGCVPYFEDRDGDGWGGSLERCLCAGTEEFPSPRAGDCDDGDAGVFPGAVEVCDELGVDEDCDEATPNGDVLYYFDADGDNYGTATTERHCSATGPFRATTAGDCDDTDDTVNPDGVEVCNGVDDDCDPTTAEDGLVTGADGQGYPDIQSALDAAGAGDIVRVCPGTFVEALTIEDSVSLVGLAGADATIVDARGAGSTLLVLSGDVRLEGLTLTGGVGTLVGDVALGGGALVLDGATLTLDQCVVRGNQVDGYGGGLYASGPLSLTNSLVYDNSATDFGGGLHSDGPELTLTDSSVFYNQAARGAGLDLLGGTVLLTDSQVAGNFGDNGGGIHVRGNATLTDGTVSSNSASLAGAGLYVDAGAGTLRLVDVTVEDNVSVTEGGGGVALASGTLISEGSDWVDAETDCYRSNYPNDVYTVSERYCASGDADFTCTVGGCTGAVYLNCDCIRR